MELKEVFEPVLHFIKNLQKKDKELASKQAAKDRLKLVLMQDRASVSPDFFELMKQEIIDVIKKYIEIDEESLEVELTRGLEAGLEGPALYANIPIKNVKPVAPKNDNDEENKVLSEEEAEVVAEQILNQIEANIVNETKSNSQEEKIEVEILPDDKVEEMKKEIENQLEELKEVEKEILEDNVEAEKETTKEVKEEPKKDVKKAPAKKSTKTTSKKTKSTTKKSTSSKTKKDSKK